MCGETDSVPSQPAGGRGAGETEEQGRQETAGHRQGETGGVLFVLSPVLLCIVINRDLFCDCFVGLQVLAPQTKFYSDLGQECVSVACSVDLFLFNNAYIDVATLSQVKERRNHHVHSDCILCC